MLGEVYRLTNIVFGVLAIVVTCAWLVINIPLPVSLLLGGVLLSLAMHAAPDFGESEQTAKEQARQAYVNGEISELELEQRLEDAIEEESDSQWSRT